MEIGTLIIINWALLNGILSLSDLSLLVKIRELNKNVFYWSVLFIISLLWIIAFFISIVSASTSSPLPIMPLPY